MLPRLARGVGVGAEAGLVTTGKFCLYQFVTTKIFRNLAITYKIRLIVKNKSYLSIEFKYLIFSTNKENTRNIRFRNITYNLLFYVAIIKY